MKPISQQAADRTQTGKVRLERMWIKRDGKLECAFVKVIDNAPTRA